MSKATLEFIAGDGGLISDGDWIESKDQDSTGTIRLIQLADIGDGQFLNKSRKFINDATLNRLNCTLLKKGDVLIARMPDPLGRACVFPELDQRAITAVDVCIIRPNSNRADSEWLAFRINAEDIRREIQSHAQGATRARVPTGKLKTLSFKIPPPVDQRQIAARLKAQLTEVETARKAAQVQLEEITKLADSIIYESIKKTASIPQSLGDVLIEVKKGIGQDWKNYPVLGATRDGLAPAKEQAGKQALKYKPVFPGTVFYNPMRVLIGSIAFVDEDDAPGITSPDYVALQGKEGVVDSRWFYYWLRSPLGEQCILSLARGAVRERMLFNRLAEGSIALPSFAEQKKASAALKELRPLRRSIEKKLAEIELLPQKILAQAFNP